MLRSKRDWLVVGLNILGQEGVGGLTIQRMTAELGVTKGSFYHHFQHVRDFQEQLVAFWAEQYISTSSPPLTGTDQLLPLLDRIMEDAFSAVTKSEVAIRAWAHQDEMVQAAVEQVDAVRQAFVLDVFLSVTDSEREARLMADMFTTMLIGSITVLPRIPPQRVLELYREFKRLHGL